MHAYDVLSPSFDLSHLPLPFHADTYTILIVHKHTHIISGTTVLHPPHAHTHFVYLRALTHAHSLTHTRARTHTVSPSLYHSLLVYFSLSPTLCTYRF